MENELILKLDKETTLPLIERLGKSAYAIAVAYGFRGTEQEWLDSLKGPKGDPFKFSDFTEEQLNALKGEQGPPGPPGTGANVDLSAYTTKQEAEKLYLKKVDIRNYIAMLGDPKYILRTELNNLKGAPGRDGLSAYDIAQLEGFTGTRQEWLDSLKAKVTLPKTVTALKRKNIYISDDQLDTVLTKFIDLMGDNINVMPKPLGYTKPRVGQNFIKFTGEPHFKVSLNGGDKVEFETTNLKVNIPSDVENSVRVDYYNLLDEVIKTVVITLSDTASDELDLGAFVKDVELKPDAGEYYDHIAGTGKVYDKGIKLLLTELYNPNNSNSTLYLTQKVIQSVKGGTVPKNVEVDYTALNNSGGVLPEEINDTYYWFSNVTDTMAIKINKNQVYKRGWGPMSPNIVGQSNTIKFTGLGGPPGIPHKKVKINGSEVVEMNDGVQYTYNFDTDSITYDN